MAHCQTQHGVVKEGLGQGVDKESSGGKPRTYRMVFSTNTGPRSCPVEGCSGRTETRTEMKMHLWHRQIWDTVVILE